MRGGFLDMTWWEWLAPFVLLCFGFVAVVVFAGLSVAAVKFCNPKPARRGPVRRRLSKIVGQDGQPLVVEEDR